MTTGKTKITSSGFFGGMFKGDFFKAQPIVSESDIAALENYNKLLSNNKPQEAFEQAMKNASQTAQNLAKSAKGASVDINAIPKASKAAAAGMKLLSGVMNVGLSMAITYLISGIYKMAGAYDEMSQQVADATAKYKEQSSSIEDYKGKITELKTELSSENLTYAEARDKRSQLLDIQKQLIDTYGYEAKGIDLVNGSLDDQVEKLDKLNKQKRQEWENEVNKQSTGQWWQKWGGYLGLALLDTVTLDWSFYDANKWLEDFDNTTNIERITEKFENFKKNVSLNDLEIDDEELEKLKTQIDSYEGVSFKGNKMTIAGDAKTVAETVTKIQTEVIGSREDLQSLNQDLKDVYNSANKIIGANWDTYNQALENKILDDDTSLEYYGKLTEAYETYQEALKDGDENAMNKAKEDYSKLLSDISNSDMNETWKKFFENMYPDISDIVDDWKFEVDIVPKIIINRDGLKDDIKTVKGLTTEEISAAFENNGTGVSKDQWKAITDLNAEAQTNGLDLTTFLEQLREAGYLVSQLDKDIEKVVNDTKNKYGDGVDWGKYFKDNSIDTQEEIDKWNEVTSGIDNAEDAMNAYAEATKNANEMTDALESLNKALDNIQSAYDKVKSAIDEYNEQGYLSVDTYQSLMELEPQYINMLIDENGKLNLNTDAVNENTKAYLQNLGIKSAEAMLDTLTTYSSEAEQLDYLSGALDTNTKATWENVYAKLEQLKVDGKITDEVYNSALARLDAYQTMTNDAIAGIGSGGLSSGKNGSDKNKALDDYLKKAEASLKIHKDELKYIDELQYAHDNLAKTDEERADILEKMDKAREDYTKREIEAIDNIQSAYKTLQTALEEKNEYGNISVDTLQSLLELEPQYINMIIDENGKLALNEQTVQNCTAAYIDNLAAKSALNLIDSVSHLKTEQEQLALLTGEAQQTGEALWDLVAAQLAVVTAGSSAEVGAALTRQVEAIKNMAASAKAGLASGGLNGFESAKARNDLAEKEAEFAEKMADAWKEEHLERLKDGLEQQKDIIDRYKKNVEVLDFGLDHIEDDDFENRSDLLSDKLEKLKSYGTAMRAEFERISNIMPQTGDEAAELASRMEELGSEMRDNVSTIRETVTAIQMLNIDIASTLVNDRMGELQSQLDNIDRRIEILNSDYKDEYRYASNVLSMDMLLPMSTEYDKKRREKQRADKALIKTEQETQDKINEIVTKSLEMQAKENAAAREKERQDLIKDMEKARQEASKKLAQAHRDYKGFLKDNEKETDISIQNIEDAFRNANLEFSAIDSTKLEQSIEEVIKKMSGKTIDVTVNVEEGSYTGGGGGTPRSGVLSKSLTQGLVPGGSCIYLTSPSGDPDGHVGIFDGEGYIYHNLSGIVKKNTLDELVSQGFGYKGWGWNGGTQLTSDQASNVIDIMKNPSKYGIRAKANMCQAWVADIYGKATGAKISAASATAAGKKWIIGYAKGTKFHPGGLALVGDENYLKGWNKPAPELAVYPGGAGEVLGTHGAEIRNLPRGTKVIPAKQTKDLLSNVHSYADGTGDITLTEGETTEITVKFNFDEWRKNEEYVVDSFDEFVEQIDKISKAYVAQSIDENKALEALTLLKDHNTDMFWNYFRNSPLDLQNYHKYGKKTGENSWSYGLWDVVNGIARDTSSELYKLLSSGLYEKYAPLLKPLIEARKASKEAVIIAHDALPTGGTPQYHKDKTAKMFADFGTEWMLNSGKGHLVSQLKTDSQSYKNALEYAAGANNGFGQPYLRDDNTWGYKGIDDNDIDNLTAHGISYQDMMASPEYQIDGTYGENASRAQTEAFRALENATYQLTDYTGDISALMSFYIDNIALFSNSLPADTYIIDRVDAILNPLQAKVDILSGAFQDLSSEDEKVRADAVEKIVTVRAQIDAELPKINEELAKVFADGTAQYADPTIIPREEAFGENDWGKWHPMLTGITPEDFAGGELSLNAKAAYEKLGYGNVVVFNSGQVAARLNDGVTEDELASIANILLRNAPDNKKRLGGMLYETRPDGAPTASGLISGYVGQYGAEATNQWIDANGNIYKKGLLSTVVTSLTNPSEVTIAVNGNIEVPEEYENLWAQQSIGKVKVTEKTADSVFVKALAEQGYTFATDDSNDSSTTSNDSNKKVSDNPLIAEIEGFYDEVANRIAKINSGLMVEEQKILNSDMSDLDKSLALYKLKRDAGVEASKQGEEVYGWLVDSFNKWMALVEEDSNQWSLEVYNAYRDALSDISEQTYAMADSAAEAMKDAVELQWKEVEKSIADIEDYISARNLYEDWDVYGDSELKAIQRQTALIEDAYKKRLLSFEEYTKKLEEYSQRIYSLGQSQLDKHLSNIDKYIEARNHYNDWDNFSDSEIKAIKRQCEILEEAYALNLISLEDYTEKAAEYTKKLYTVAKNTIIETISDLVNEYEEMKQFESSQLDSQKTLLQSYYDVINAATDAQYAIDKELRASQSMYEYLNEETRELLFNQEDYNALSEKLLDIQNEANALQEKYNSDILNASEETLAEMTSEYQMQYQTMMKQYEIAKAELDVAKKRQKLDNVLAERNTRMFINGQWQWVANTQDVINAQNELADAEIERKRQEASLEQTEAINDFTKQINAIETDLNQVRKKWSDMQEMLEGEADEVAKALEEISQVASPELKRIIEATGGSVESFSLSLSESTTTLSTIITSNLDTMSTGIDTVITDLQSYSTAIQNLVEKINNIEINKLEDEVVDDGKLTTSEIIALMKANSEKWDAATDEERVDLHATNKAYGDMIGARYDSDTGVWYAANGSPLYSPSSSGGDSSSNKSGTSSVPSSGGSTSTTTPSKQVNTSDQYVKDSSGDIQSNPNWDGKTSGGVGTFYKHADGTRYTPGGLTALGEEGFEAFITSDGRLIPISQPTIGNIGAGGVVFNREQMANLRNLWDLSNLSRVSPFVTSSNASSQNTVIDNSIHINGLTVGEQGNEDWINGLRRYVATHK